MYTFFNVKNMHVAFASGEHALLLVSFFYSSPNIFSFDLDVVDPVVSQETRLETQ